MINRILKNTELAYGGQNRERQVNRFPEGQKTPFIIQSGMFHLKFATENLAMTWRLTVTTKQADTHAGCDWIPYPYEIASFLRRS